MTADKDEDGCDQYTNNPSWCGGEFADFDFDPMAMCCVCGGGQRYCANTNYDSNNDLTGDRDGDNCDDYADNPSWCDGGYDDDDFNAKEMCCVCGGGDS